MEFLNHNSSEKILSARS